MALNDLGGASTGSCAALKRRCAPLLHRDLAAVPFDRHGTRLFGTRHENIRVTGVGDPRTAPKPPVMPVEPVAIIVSAYVDEPIGFEALQSRACLAAPIR
jgi:hypothetical protein